MSDRLSDLLRKALQTLQPEERDELLHGLVLGQLTGGVSAPIFASSGVAARSSLDQERLQSLLAWGIDLSPAGARLKVLPVRLPEGDYERLRGFCAASGFSMAVVIRTLVERFLAHESGHESA